MLKFIHLSDLHFHRAQGDNVAAQVVLDFIAEKYQDHYLLITGDITDDGHIVQYEQAQRALLPFQGRLFLCPGNHDFGAAGNFYSPQRARAYDHYLSEGLEQGGVFAGENAPLVTVLRDGGRDIMLIALDTNLETTQPFDFACGEVGEKQMALLANVLRSQAALSATKILYFHHHPFIHNNPFMEMKDAAELWRTVYGQLDVMAFGHKHSSEYYRNVNGVGHVLAADNSPGKNFAREILVDGGSIQVSNVPISVNGVRLAPPGPLVNAVPSTRLGTGG